MKKLNSQLTTGRSCHEQLNLLMQDFIVQENNDLIQSGHTDAGRFEQVNLYDLHLQ